VSNQNDKMLK